MYELGEFSEKYHEEVGRFCDERKLEHVVFVGNHRESFEKGFNKKVKGFLTIHDLNSAKIDYNKFDCFYLKGSRGVKLEMFLNNFK